MSSNDPVATAVQYALMFLGLMTLAKWFLMELGDWFRWLKEWSRTL